MSKAMSLKAKIRNIAKQKNIPAQVILQNYMFERLLVRLSASEYKEKFVLKGGMLVAAIVGLDNRATMDLDTTLKNLPLTPDAIRSALEQVCAISLDDGVVFEIGTISPIREDDIYGGYRVTLNARFDTLLKILCIEPGIAGGVDHVVENVFWISGFLHQDLDEIADAIVFAAGELPNEIDTVHDGHSVRIIVQIHNETGTRVEVVNGHCGQSGGFCGLCFGLSGKRGILGPDGLQLGGQAGILGTECVKLHVGISCADRGACSARDEGESSEDNDDDLFHGKNSFQ